MSCPSAAHVLLQDPSTRGTCNPSYTHNKERMVYIVGEFYANVCRRRRKRILERLLGFILTAACKQRQPEARTKMDALSLSLSRSLRWRPWHYVPCLWHRSFLGTPPSCASRRWRHLLLCQRRHGRHRWPFDELPPLSPRDGHQNPVQRPRNWWFWSSSSASPSLSSSRPYYRNA